MTSPQQRGHVVPTALAALAVASARLDHAGQGARERWRLFVRGVLTEALGPEELEELTVRLYACAPSRYSGRSLADWEDDLFDRALPPAPARLLVTAAGSGREARALARRGYRLDTLEPVPAMSAACANIAGVDLAVTATHDDLVAAVTGRGGPAAALAGREYDAVLIGWGSFTHILSRERQVGLLTACDRLAPSGPILLSFFARHSAPPTMRRVHVAGARLGRALGRLRGLPPKDVEIGLAWHLGFTHAFSADEIAALAASVGRTADVTLTPYGHAVLRPGDGPDA